jgi:hypothetical protein
MLVTMAEHATAQSVPVVVPAEQESAEDELLLSLVMVSVLDSELLLVGPLSVVDSGGELEDGGTVVGTLFVVESGLFVVDPVLVGLVGLIMPVLVLDSEVELDEDVSVSSLTEGGVLQLCRNGIGMQGKWKDGIWGQCYSISGILGRCQTTIPPPPPPQWGQ